MRISWSSHDVTWTLRLRLDEDDGLEGPGQNGDPVSLVTNSCTVRLPTTIAEPHPDVLALAGLLIVRPWVRHRLTLDRPVSASLAEALDRVMGLDAGPVDDALPPRTPTGRIGLSYSSGVDSMAVSELLDPQTPYLHFKRTKHPRIPNRATHIRSDQTAELVRRAGERGRDVYVVESDLEYLCLPWPQFPSWPAIGMAGVFLADHLDLGALAYGSVLEAVYLAGGRRYTGGGTGGWASLFSTVGLTMCRPAAGLTEVGTLLLATGSPLADLAQSCLLGAAGRPCLACVKCVRKELITAAVERRPVRPEIRDRLRSGDPAARDLDRPPPLYMQNSMEYAAARIPDLGGTLLGDLAKRMAATVDSTSWNERYYPRALVDEVPARWRAEISARLDEQVEWMTVDDVKVVETWDGASRIRGGGPAGAR